MLAPIPALRRGAVVRVDLDPVVGSEANKVRPAIVVSSDLSNAAVVRTGSGMITVIPLTSNLTRIYPFQALVRAAHSGLPFDSKAQAEQVRSVDARRVLDVAAQLPAETVAAIDAALLLHLAL